MRPRMRSLLADWLIEVCEEFALHRETYYMSMNFIDRYLSLVHSIPKSQIQLIGCACLFTASKIQEIYPPRLSSFADLTDGACSEGELLKMELEILKVLDWKVSPVTVTSWLELYLQTASFTEEPTLGRILGETRYNKAVFYCVCQLLDFATLDYTCVRFSPGVIAATALHLYKLAEIDVPAITGFDLNQLAPCIKWMELYASALEKNDLYLAGPVALRRSVTASDVHNIQGHTNRFELFDEVYKRLEGVVLLTPPKTPRPSAETSANRAL